MLIVGLNGSPNKQGNTFNLLKVALAEAQALGAQVETIQVSECLEEIDHPFCVVCSSPCQGVCSQGSKLGDAFEILQKAAGVIVGSPVYYGTVSGQLKAFWDMSRFLRTEKALINQVGGAVTCGAARFGGQETTIKAIHDMLLVQGFIVVGDGHENNDAGHHGACAQAPSLNDDNALARARILGKRIFQVAEATGGIRK